MSACLRGTTRLPPDGFCRISYLGCLFKCVGPLRVLLEPKKTGTLREDASTFTILRCYLPLYTAKAPEETLPSDIS